MDAGLFRVEKTQLGVPVTVERFGACGGATGALRGHRAGGAKFWFHGLRNAFITVAERELMLLRSLTKRLVNHARPGDVTEEYAADRTVEQLREPAQRIADRIDDLMTEVPAADAHLLVK